MRHKDNPATLIAEIGHALLLEHHRLCLQSNSMEDVFRNRIVGSPRFSLVYHFRNRTACPNI